MSDYQELKRLAEALRDERSDWQPTQASFYYHQALRDPAAVLDMLSKLEELIAQHGRDSKELRDLCQARDDVRGQRDQLKAEVEALRNQVDRLLAHCPDGECAVCGEIVCPHGGAMHFHHDGCPSCAEHEAAMSKEAGQ